MTFYTAKQVPVFKLRRQRNRMGHIVPPECHVEWPAVVPILFDAERIKIVGTAILKRVENVVYADFEIGSPMNVTNGLPFLRRLTPSVDCQILEAYEDVLLGLLIDRISLSPMGNVDRGILPLGELLTIKDAVSTAP